MSVWSEKKKEETQKPNTHTYTLSHSLTCPECNSSKLFKDGLRTLRNGIRKQRYLCRICGYRFTDPSIKSNIAGQISEVLNPGLDDKEIGIVGRDFSVKKVSDSFSFAIGKDVSSHSIATVEKGLNNFPFYNSNSQLCALNKKAKKLETATELKTVAGDEILSVDTKGILTQFLAYLEKEGYCAESEYEGRVRRLAKLGANLRDPESVKAVIGRMQVKDGMKMQYECAYNAVCDMLKIQWDRPHYKQEEHDPFIPDETELDALINSARSKRLAVYLQTLKETFADPSEALRIKWIDVDEKQRTIKINHPVKGHYTRTLEVSNKLLSMLSALPRKSDRVFSCQYQSILATFTRMKKRLAETQKNPRLLSVELRSFRHWGGTMIAFHTNGNVLMVKKLLGHKRIENSMKYIGRINFKDDQFETTSTTTVEEILKLGSAGWIEYSIVKTNGMEIHCFKKPKRFASYA